MTETYKAYAEALFALAAEDGRERSFLAFLEEISGLLNGDCDLFNFLSAPNIPFDAREKLLSQIIGDMPEHIFSYTALLCKKGLLRSFDSCLQEYRLLLFARESVVMAKVISAVPLSEHEKQALVSKLEKTSKKKVVLSYEVDSSVIGGVLIEMDGKRIDGTLRHRLAELKGVMANE